MKRSINLVYQQRRTPLVWYDGTSDGMVEKAAQTLLALPASAPFLLKDMHGEIVPISACLPQGDYTVVMYAPHTHASVSSEDGNVRSSHSDTPVSPPRSSAKRPSRSTTAAAPPSSTLKKFKKQSPTSLMKLFLDAFTIPLSPDDVVNFIPNHGDFGIDRLYGLLVPPAYLPQDTTTFYKLASSSIVLDRQRVIRYYRVGDAYAQLLAVGKGPLLRAYVDPASLRTPPHQAKLEAFAAATGTADHVAASEDRLLVLYERFLHGFTPISRTEFLTDSE
ncbi:Aste57867_12362 [Aphanomyces stellatus]|uniref:Aste57867_12362 protein n=1 Tax=Aphanomyces stellatus TaxID=120398 RepID=A0A485KVS2_9STRA|nr:hypothetical protein As57867_012316 [Aphanomyces stellatus]VFT89214.1 Aste57867_12362 [Aphanomyces stellatus]